MSLTYGLKERKTFTDDDIVSKQSFSSLPYDCAQFSSPVPHMSLYFIWKKASPGSNKGHVRREVSEVLYYEEDEDDSLGQ